MRRYPTRTLAAIMSIAGVLLAVLTVPQAVAENSSDSPSTSVIIDASGSMLAPDAGGQTRMDAAKQATEGLLNDLPKEQRLSLLTYGTQTGSGDEEKAAGCQDVTTLVPMGGNRAEMVSKVKGLNPRGYTPIGKSLQQAEKELPGQGGRQIVLVSDGIDTCAPPPVCEVAKQIRERGVDIVINVIGLNVDDQARSELQCVAKEGGGSYADAKDAASLKEQLVLKSTRNLQGYKSGGEQAHGTPKASEARPIEAGEMKDGKPDPKHYQDVMPAVKSDSKQELHWKVKLEKGERLGIGYILPPPPVAGNSLGSYIIIKAVIKGPGGASACEDKNMSGNSSEFSQPVAGYAFTKVAGEGFSSCEPGEYDVFVESSGPAAANQDLPLELMLWKVPEAADATTTSAPPTDKPQPTNVELGTSAGKLPSALGPSEAPTVKPGTYDVEIVPGEMLWFKVPVAEGQRLQMAFDVPPIDVENPNDLKEDLGRRISWNVMGPTFYPLSTNALKDDTYFHDDNVEAIKDKTTTGTMTTQPIRWNNMNSSDSDVSGSFVSGEQYVALRYSTLFRKADQNTQSIPIKFRVAVAATGEVEKAPTLSYKGEQQSTTASAATDSSSTSANADGGNSTGGIRRTATTLAVGGGAVGLVALLVIGVVIITRKRR
ncbi:VWA domain-containing protein [Corynebacterium durum]|uniref:vWA domain-containing protein n=1 Tax=Corynebacterium durum TaxID=61592 RepID=UPI0028E2DAAC|nr:VWA domain-containing protein [Corynebacterium durum]